MARTTDLIVGGLLLSMTVAPAAAQTTPSSRDASFSVFVRGRSVGTERLTVRSSAEGTVLSGSGSLGAPFNVALRQAEIVYDPAWRPVRLSLQATINNAPFALTTTMEGARATNEIIENERLTSKVDDVAGDAVLLPNSFFGAYHAVGARLSSLEPGATLSLYVAPQAETRLTLESVLEERIQTPSRTFLIRRHLVSVDNAAGPMRIEVWMDDEGRLARVSVPGLMLDVVREDLATVAARRQTVWREGDEDVRVPASGFSLAGTLSKPAGPSQGRLPVVVLVQGSGERDRDEIIASVPIHGQLASQLADAGFLVLRYDKRGVGQSGGRAESVTIADYAEDVRAAVRYLGDRRDVDRRRIAVLGHGEGAAVALLTTRREKRVAAAVLVAGFGSTGADLVLEQQRAVLERSTMTQVERQAKIDLQTRIHEAVLSGRGWEELPAELRASADTAWFRSLLAFDPARIMKDVRQPVLVVHGELDRQMPMAQGEQLAALAAARRRDRVSRFARLPGLNHLLTMAVTGQVDEYATLSDKQVSAEVGRTIGEWLREVLRLPPAPTSQARAGTSSAR